MKFSQWCAQDPRRLPHQSTAAPDQPTHLWFGSNWQDRNRERWIVQWAPMTGELYARNPDWDVWPIGHIPTVEHFHEAYDALKILQSAPDSLRLLTQIMEEAAAVWELEPDPADDVDIEL